MRKYNLNAFSLFDKVALTIARNLLPTMDDAAISQATGLRVETVAQLRGCEKIPE